MQHQQQQTGLTPTAGRMRKEDSTTRRPRIRTIAARFESARARTKTTTTMKMCSRAASSRRILHRYISVSNSVHSTPSRRSVIIVVFVVVRRRCWPPPPFFLSWSVFLCCCQGTQSSFWSQFRKGSSKQYLPTQCLSERWKTYCRVESYLR